MAAPTPTKPMLLPVANVAAVLPSVPSLAANPSVKHSGLNGVWILDKSRKGWSMRGYLETLHVNELAIQAHERGELEYEILHKIEMDAQKVKITKRARVGNDLVVQHTLGKESIESLKPDNRHKKCLAVLENSESLKITNSLLTMNGMVHVEDAKSLVQEEGKSTVLMQKLTIVNEQTREQHTTVRYFLRTTADKIQPIVVAMDTR